VLVPDANFQQNAFSSHKAGCGSCGPPLTKSETNRLFNR
jgi:hypothetical protein